MPLFSLAVSPLVCGYFPASGIILLGIRASPFLLGFLYILRSDASLFLSSIFKPFTSEFIFVYHSEKRNFYPFAIASLYSIMDMINKFRHGISFSSTSRERDMLMDHCSSDERENMDTSDDPSALYFYMHLPIIYDLGVMVPFTFFEIEFLTGINVTPSQITPNVWGILRAFQMI
ncbi:unnamed protein product [Vicia faba]|uniref:Uncharacterized protein n=1 Tax=Vicia faba TaxID=3906 RepID=A0AAV0YIG7_VICFA|nr:unnamed protein product [Vicia faba]